MILFADDWNDYPTAIVDYKTTNESFLRNAALYDKMGVKNSTFSLALLQPHLQGIDPFDMGLDVETIASIGIECSYNPWYFFREILRIPAVAANTPDPLRANRGNIALYWLYMNHIDVALIQPRQTGKSISTDGLMTWLNQIGSTNTLTNLITKDDKLRKENVARLKKMRDLLPPYLRPKHPDDTDNQTEVTCHARGNRYKTAVAQASESAANNIARGLSSPTLHVDEGPFISWIEVTLPAALASGGAAREQAAKFNRPHGNIFTTTAGKIDSRDGRYMYDLINGGTVWSEHFFDTKNHEELLDRVTKARNGGKKTIVNCTFSHRQLGYTDKWLDEKMADANAFGEVADRDFLNRWTSGSLRSPLSVKINEIIRGSEMDVVHQEISKQGFLIKWYDNEISIKRRMATGNFAMGLDTSDAVGRDAIAGVITDLSDMSTIGTITANESNLTLFSQTLCDFLVKYKNVTLIPERKSSAQGIIDYLWLQLPLEGEDPFRRIYNTIVDDASLKPEEYSSLGLDLGRRNMLYYESRKGKFGFNTNAQSRLLLYSSILQNAAKNSGAVIRDKTLAGEIRSLVEKNGRIDHGSSGHDDFVIAWLLTHWFATTAKNLQHYGIDVSKINSVKSFNHADMSENEIAIFQEQQTYIAEITGILKQLETCEDEFQVMRLERRLNVLNARVSLSEEELYSIDAMIIKTKENRKEKVRNSLKRQSTINVSDVLGKSLFGMGGIRRAA